MSRRRRMLGDLARMWGSMILGCCSLATWSYHVGGPAPMWDRVAIAAAVGVMLAIVAERLSPLF